MKKIPFEDGVKVSNAKVTIDDVDYNVTPAQYSGATPFSAYNLNQMQDNIETGLGGTVLWTNPNTYDTITDTFDAQTIQLESETDFDLIEIVFAYEMSGYLRSPKSLTNQRFYITENSSGGTTLQGNGYYSKYSYPVTRDVRATCIRLDSAFSYSISFEDAQMYQGSIARTTVNKYIIPRYVIGYKTGIFS